MCVLYECVGCVFFLSVSLWVYATYLDSFCSHSFPLSPTDTTGMYLELSQESGIKCDDLVSTMQYYGLLKYWKGKHIVLRRKVCMLYIKLLTLCILQLVEEIQ